MAHTPGPWEEGRRHESMVKIMAVDKDTGKHEEICTCHGGLVRGWPDNEMSANARLITAAPDLLQALQLIIALDDDSASEGAGRRLSYGEYDMASTAIAKAVGDRS